MSRSRYVFDTNVIISALLFGTGKPAIAFRYALQTGENLLSLALPDLGLKPYKTLQKFTRSTAETCCPH